MPTLPRWLKQTTRANALASILQELEHLEDAHLFRQTRCVADVQTDDPVAGLDRADTVTRARKAGMGACCGGILGLEENDGKVLDLA